MKQYTLETYARRLREAHLLVKGQFPEVKDTLITGLTYNSKDVTPGTLFICKGAAFREEYLADAAERGAVCYVSETLYHNVDIPVILVSDIRRSMPFLADLFFGSPATQLHLTGITGTKGKSTTTYYLKAILDDFLAARNEPESAVISSIDTYDGVALKESHITTPESVELMRHFRNAVDSHIDFLTMEVSSQALKYNRVDEITFDVGVFMNISEDHISPIEHPTMEDYFASKLRIFAQTRTALVCTDMDRFDDVMDAAKESDRVITFGLKEGSDVLGYDVKKVGTETHFRVRCERFDEAFVLTVPGLFNVQNALAAIAAANVYGIPLEFIRSGLLRARSKGRMECFTSKDGKIVAIVDYAHNKLSFETLFSSMKEEYPDRAIVSIFGCPGKKALVRRKDLGTIAGQYSKKVYLCAEDPGEEPVDEISRDIAQYVTCPVEMIEDRGEAIRAAIAAVEEPTILLITGKGDETRQKYGRAYVDCKSDIALTKEAIAAYDEA